MVRSLQPSLGVLLIILHLDIEHCYIFFHDFSITGHGLSGYMTTEELGGEGERAMVWGPQVPLYSTIQYKGAYENQMKINFGEINPLIKAKIDSSLRQQADAQYNESFATFPSFLDPVPWIWQAVY